MVLVKKIQETIDSLPYLVTSHRSTKFDLDALGQRYKADKMKPAAGSRGSTSASRQHLSPSSLFL